MELKITQDAYGEFSFRIYVTDEDIIVGGGFKDRDAAIAAAKKIGDRIREGDLIVHSRIERTSNIRIGWSALGIVFGALFGALMAVWIGDSLESPDPSCKAEYWALAGCLIGGIVPLCGAILKGATGVMFALLWAGLAIFVLAFGLYMLAEIVAADIPYGYRTYRSC